jgi:hypothetical protein
MDESGLAALYAEWFGDPNTPLIDMPHDRPAAPAPMWGTVPQHSQNT